MKRRNARRVFSVRRLARLGLVVGATCTVVSADGVEVVQAEVVKLLVCEDAAFCQIAGGRSIRVA